MHEWFKQPLSSEKGNAETMRSKGTREADAVALEHLGHGVTWCGLEPERMGRTGAEAKPKRGRYDPVLNSVLQAFIALKEKSMYFNSFFQ